MKKIFIIIILLCSFNPVFAEFLEATATYNWVDKTQTQRSSEIINIKKIISEDESLPDYYSRDGFKASFAPYLKDSLNKKRYMMVVNNVKETENYKIAGFFKGSILVAYGIQYKDDPQFIYYYNVLGKLIYLDILSNNYPNLPYYSKQYKPNGKCNAIFYYLSDDTQFSYSPKYEFIGLWQGENMYDEKGKKIISRTTY